MSNHDQQQPKLTKNQKLVLETLVGAGNPLSAYSILDALREHGFRAPLQVYRALNHLIEQGLVHRLESLNAFVACSHPACETHEAVVFAICDDCGNVGEITDTELNASLAHVARDADFEARQSTVELRGVCRACRAARPEHAELR